MNTTLLNEIIQRSRTLSLDEVSVSAADLESAAPISIGARLSDVSLASLLRQGHTAAGPGNPLTVELAEEDRDGAIFI